MAVATFNASCFRQRGTHHARGMHGRALLRCKFSRPRFNQPRRNLCQSAYKEAPPVEEIISLQNALVKHCVKVRQNRSYREEEGTVILSGADLVQEVSEHASIKVLFVVQGAPLPGVPAQRVVTVTSAVMQKITGLESVSPSTLAAEVAIPPPADFAAGWRPGQLQRVLVLERLQDPGNLGTLLRTALALGWQACILLPGCCDPFNDKALRAGRGAAFKLPLASGDLYDLRRVARAHRLVCLAAEPHAAAAGSSNGAGGGAGAAQPRQQQPQQPQQDAGEEWDSWLWGEEEGGVEPAARARGGDGAQAPRQSQQQQQQGVCLVLGSEGQGLSEEVLQLSTPVVIPMLGNMESLNVAAAGAILMFSLSPGAPQLQTVLDGLRRGSSQPFPPAQQQAQPERQQRQQQQQRRVSSRAAGKASGP